MKLKKLPPKNLWDLSILTDSAVCSDQTEIDLFAQETAEHLIAYNRYCIFDVTYGVWRILIEGRCT